MPMRLSLAFLARSAEITQDGSFHVLGGGLDGFTASSMPPTPSTPAVIPSLAIVAGVHFTPVECEKVYAIEIILSDQDGNQIGQKINHSFAATINHLRPELGSYQKLVVNINGLVLPKVGIYSFQFVIDGALVGELKFNLDVVPAPEQDSR
jgi:hypothetical protein